MEKGKVDYKNGDVGFDRNRRLIDFEYIPDDLVSEISQAFDVAPEPDRSNLFSYFVENKLSKLMDHIREF